jgi:hypothetical protein
MGRRIAVAAIADALSKALKNVYQIAKIRGGGGGAL